MSADQNRARAAAFLAKLKAASATVVDSVITALAAEYEAVRLEERRAILDYLRRDPLVYAMAMAHGIERGEHREVPG